MKRPLLIFGNVYLSLEQVDCGPSLVKRVPAIARQETFSKVYCHTFLGEKTNRERVKNYEREWVAVTWLLQVSGEAGRGHPALLVQTKEKKTIIVNDLEVELDSDFYYE